MKKILIISYYFNPCNMTPAFRTYSWAKYFKQNGYYPVIVTRNWDIPITNQLDTDIPTGSQIRQEKHEDYEVYYLPFKGNLRTRLHLKLQGSVFAFITKPLILIEMFFQNAFPFILPFSNFFQFANDYVKKNKNLDFIIISANPYPLFKIGYTMKKKFGVKWVADYRDDWSTSEIKLKNNYIYKLKYLVDAYFEKKWVRTADIVTTVSDHYVNKIQTLLNKKCNLIENGYYHEMYNQVALKPLFSEYTIVYNGTLYDEQPIELFLGAFKQIVREFNSKLKLRIMFLGLAFNKRQTERVKNELSDYTDYYLITERMDNSKIIEIQLRSHLLLMVSHKGLKGVPGSKLYEYIGSRRPVLICPSDHDIIDQTLKKTGQAIICNTYDEAYSTLKKNIEDYLLNKKTDISINTQEIQQYSRAHQCKLFAELLNNNLLEG